MEQAARRFGQSATPLAQANTVRFVAPDAPADAGAADSVVRPGTPNVPPPVAAARLVVLGDSISAGVGATTPFLSYGSLLWQNDDAVYPDDRGDDLRSVFGPGLQFINVANSGDTTAMVVHNQLPRLEAAPGADAATLAPLPVRGHTVVVLTVGGNDVRMQLGPRGDASQVLPEALANLSQVFAFFGDRRRFPDGASIYFGSVYDITDGQDSAHLCLAGLRFVGLSKTLWQWHSAYQELAQAAQREYGPLLRITLVDVHGLFMGHGFRFSDAQSVVYAPHDPTLWMDEQDCIHPNNRGHHELRRAFFAAIVGRRR